MFSQFYTIAWWRQQNKKAEEEKNAQSEVETENDEPETSKRKKMYVTQHRIYQ